MIYHYSPFTSKLLSVFNYVHLKYSTQKLYSQFTTLLSMSWSLTSSESLTFIVSSTAPVVEMSLFCYFFTHIFSFWQCIPVSVWLSWNMVRLHVAWGSNHHWAGIIFCVQVIYVIVKVMNPCFHRLGLPAFTGLAFLADPYWDSVLEFLFILTCYHYFVQSLVYS